MQEAVENANRADQNVENESSGRNKYLWIAGAAGAAAGVAALIATRHRETTWEKAQRRTLEVAGNVREQVEPWMAISAAAAVGAAGLAYALRSKPSGWEKARRRAVDMAGQCDDAVRPWMSLVASAALGAAAMARSRKQRDRILDHAGDAARGLVGTGARLMRRLQDISGETRKLYPSVRKLVS